jgi:hypothetical protein
MFGGGLGRDGGKEGLYEYAKPSWMQRVRIEVGVASRCRVVARSHFFRLHCSTLPWF